MSNQAVLQSDFDLLQKQKQKFLTLQPNRYSYIYAVDGFISYKYKVVVREGRVGLLINLSAPFDTMINPKESVTRRYSILGIFETLYAEYQRALLSQGQSDSVYLSKIAVTYDSLLCFPTTVKYEYRAPSMVEVDGSWQRRIMDFQKN